MKSIIKTSNLSKCYDNATILNNINFEVKEGEIIGLLGENGAGKTTFLKLLYGILEPTEGEILILEHSPWYEREKILINLGIMIETPVFYDHLTAYDNLKIHLNYMDKTIDINELLKAVNLLNIEDKPVCKFSMGMKQKLAIARAISHNPSILLLDEPINGLDPVAIKDLRELFIQLKEKGTTIIISSHILNEILQTVESLVVISNGKLDNLGKIEDLMIKYGRETENFLIERLRGKNDETY